jgi:hypothetical protein
MKSNEFPEAIQMDDEIAILDVIEQTLSKKRPELFIFDYCFEKIKTFAHSNQQDLGKSEHI